LEETKYGNLPIEELLTEGMRFGFEKMCIIQDSILAMLCLINTILINTQLNFITHIIYDSILAMLSGQPKHFIYI
jgi:hypothetical protein